MTPHPYHLVDVFTDQRFGGNQLAVFADARGIPEALYPQIAKELNLSETTFVLPAENPACTCKVRIFTPAEELPIAGHPTVGTTYVLVRDKLVPTPGDRFGLVLEEGVGPVPVQVHMVDGQPGRITMQPPAPTFGEALPDRAALCAAVGLQPADLEPELPVQVVSCRVPFTILPLRSRAILMRAKLNLDRWETHFANSAGPSVLLACKDPQTPQGTLHVRMFAPNHGVLEDAATGGAAGPMGGYALRNGWLPPAAETGLVIEQGFVLGRPSFLHVTVTANSPQDITRVQVGGHCVTVGRGEFLL